MSTLAWFLLAATALAALLVLVNHLTGGRLGRFVRTALTGAGMKLEELENPATGLQRVADDMRQQTADAVKGLVDGEALVDDLTRRIADRRRVLAESEAAVARLDRPDASADERRVLRDHLDRVQRERDGLADDEAALARQITENATFAAELQDAADTIGDTERQARELGVQLRVADARQAMAKSRMTFNTNGIRGGKAAAQRYIDLAKTRIARGGATHKVADLLEGADERIAREARANRGAGLLEELRAKRTKAHPA